MPLPEIPYDEWFHGKPHPHDSMPIATNDRFDMYGSSDCDDAFNPRAEEEVADWFTDKPDESDEIEKEKTIHQKMYEIATSRYNPFSVGGSENCQSDLDCSIGGSERLSKS